MKSGLYTLLNRVSDFIFGFIVFIILVRILTKEEFGTWVLFVSISALVEMTRSTFVQSADEKEYSEILSASFMLNVFITSILIVLLVLLGNAFQFMENTRVNKHYVCLYHGNFFIHILYTVYCYNAGKV